MPAIGILGGTFDPIHLGHLAMAQGAIHLAGLDRVLFMPNRQPPHKAGQLVTSAVHRAAMVQAAIADNPQFGFSALELEREGPSYTIDTIRALHDQHPGCQFAFIIGMDSLLEIKSWRDWQTLLTLTDLLVMERPGYPTPLGQELVDSLDPELGRHIRICAMPGVAVASRDLRRLAASGYPLRYLVPAAVERYVAEHHLYG